MSSRTCCPSFSWKVVYNNTITSHPIVSHTHTNPRVSWELSERVLRTVKRVSERVSFNNFFIHCLLTFSVPHISSPSTYVTTQSAFTDTIAVPPLFVVAGYYYNSNRMVYMSVSGVRKKGKCTNNWESCYMSRTPHTYQLTFIDFLWIYAHALILHPEPGVLLVLLWHWKWNTAEKKFTRG